ncbi:MAG TPA: hypothetical protein VIJ77_12065 [Candidatus Tumulicola sp.]
MRDDETVAALRGALAASEVLDSREISDALLAIMRAESARRKAVAKDLTRTQKRRVAKRLGGESIRAIAKAEGRAPSTVAESLSAPSVRAYIAARLRIMRAGDQPLFDALLERLADLAFNAQRPGPGFMVPDNRIRFEAIQKLLLYYAGDDELTRQRVAPSPGVLAPGAIAGEPIPSLSAPKDTPDIVETILERSLTATERRSVTRTKPVQNQSEVAPARRQKRHPQRSDPAQ